MNENTPPIVFVICLMCAIIVGIVCATCYNLAAYKIDTVKQETPKII